MNRTNSFFNRQNKATISLLVVMLIVFILETIFGGSENIQTLINFGAMYKPFVIGANQWWRLFTAQFLHIGILHLLSNAVMIYYAGSLLEPLIGSGKFLTVYLLSGVGGNLMSFAFGGSNTVAAGASTALFGLFGVVIALAVQLRNYPPIAEIGKQFFALAVINLVLDLFMTGVDIYGHIGGLFSGLLLGIIIAGGVKKSIFNFKIRVLALVALIIYVVYTVHTGMVM